MCALPDRQARRALEAPDLGSAVEPALRERVDRTAAGRLPEGEAMNAILTYGLRVKSLAELSAGAGQPFDPQLTPVFLELVGEVLAGPAPLRG